MAGRGLTAALISAISGNQVNTTFLLVNMNFSTPIYLTTLSRNIAWNGNTYARGTGILDIDNANETIEPRVGQLSLTLSGANQANIAAALSEDFTDAQVVIRRAVLDSIGEIIDDPVIIFDGRVDAFEIREDPLAGSSQLMWHLSSHWADFEKRAGRRSNDEDHQHFYPGDRGMEFAALIIKDLRWGRQ